MTITNNTSSDLVFEIDVNEAVKGQVANVVVSANSTFTCSVEKGFQLAKNTAFQAQITAGNITLAYTAADNAWGAAVLAYLGGTL